MLVPLYLVQSIVHLQKQLSVLPENIQANNEDPGVNSDDDDYDAEVGTAAWSIECHKT